jgi:pimeloyl-ACP methyl ester carboxylesterase
MKFSMFIRLIILTSVISCAALINLGSALAGSSGSSDYSQADLKPLELTEFTPLAVHNKGPEKAEGVIYFIEGLDKNDRSRDDFRATYPIVSQLNRHFGWDVVEAKFPNDADYGMSSIAQSSNHVIARLGALRAQGYKKIVLAGQSWGAWVSIDVAGRPTSNTSMDSLLLIAPANYGMKEYDGKPNEFFTLNKTEYVENIKSIKVPATVVFFRDDEYDPGGRGAVTQETFSRNGVPLFLIDRPETLEGHGAAWQLRFGAIYSACIDRFIETFSATTCAAPRKSPLATGVAQSEADLLKPDSGAKRVGLDDIKGKILIETTPMGFVSVNQVTDSEVRISTMDAAYSMAVSSKGEQTCVGNICRKLYRLADGGYVAVDDKGAITSWLVPAD